ncbi:MAG TPA: energy transducer TonB [Candidatus Binatia bacterium]|jgi:protein TonB|nr:energy transducer TonB [Candidatus Binatia bacterium]
MDRISPRYELTDELARFCLPATQRDPNRKLAWVNSVCILFLLVGILGTKSIGIFIKPLPPAPEELVPVVVEPVALPPQTATEQNQQQNEQQRPDTPQVVVVTPEAPNISFAVPTIGNLVVPNALAKAPPLAPLQPPAPLKTQPLNLENTGSGGERPQPPYPKIALEQAQQGTVTLLLRADEAGNIISVEVKTPSGSPLLDRSTLEFVKRHWTVPRGTGAHVFEATITYKLQAG